MPPARPRPAGVILVMTEGIGLVLSMTLMLVMVTLRLLFPLIALTPVLDLMAEIVAGCQSVVVASVLAERPVPPR